MELFDIADELDKKHLHRFAEQIERRLACRCPITLLRDQDRFQRENLFNTSIWRRRSTFENANMTDFASIRQNLIPGAGKEHLLCRTR